MRILSRKNLLVQFVFVPLCHKKLVTVAVVGHASNAKRKAFIEVSVSNFIRFRRLTSREIELKNNGLYIAMHCRQESQAVEVASLNIDRKTRAEMRDRENI